MKFVEQPIGPAPDPETADPNTIDKYYESVNLEQENYNVRSMGKTLAELHVMLELYKKGILKKFETPVVLDIREGKIQNDRKKPQGAKGKAKEKNKLAYAPKTKIPPSSKRDNLEKDYICTTAKSCGIVSQLTPPYTSQHNGVSERRNRTLLVMVRSMMNLTTLPKSFWGYALETTARILNMVPTKKVDMTPYELWHEKAPKLSYLRSYPKETIGYYFYYPLENKIFVSRNAEFFENSFMEEEASGSHRLLEMSESDKGLEIIQEIPQAPDRYGYYVDVEEYELEDLDEPPNYKAALADPESDKWLEAINTEMQVWYLVDLLSNGRIVWMQMALQEED
nr:hypothetical protein [Tanacetum cinerariifolium]GEV16652.1 hypothetical protein [Tanacetum cinerariifolium]